MKKPKYNLIRSLITGLLISILTNLLYTSYIDAASLEPRVHYVYINPKTPEDELFKNIMHFFKNSPFQRQLLMSLELDAQGYLSPGFTVSGHNSHYMGWVEICTSKPGPKGSVWQFPMLVKWHDDYLRNPALCKNIIQQESVGIGFGEKINAMQSLKVYCYQRLHSALNPAFHQSSSPEVDRNLAYSTLIGGLEMQSASYRASLNIKKSTLDRGMSQYSSMKHSEATQPVKKRYDFDLFDLCCRDQLDLIDTGHWGLSGQIQLDHFKQILPYLGIYYDCVDFIAPKAGFQKPVDGTCGYEIPYEYSFAKHVIGLNIGFQWSFPYMLIFKPQVAFKGSLDNANGWQVGATLKMHALLQTNQYNRENTLKYHRSSMYHIGPNHYTRTMTTTA